ncbi:ArgE/DapE family deacylase [Periweissella cryptocerci]|uniref:Probable succinyl-diaminopimelate desuccinylase n=1 Tax=Periweissella cryptocerci TaxID=2506420 RepID=A0A4P6YRQ4_9LACO|nr:ArgE/DapE family deacylase [Periweissella cryptocerci]QBO35282.1 ArgE/DapE family deacylase [Periweissella cryptocerci]
MDAATSFLQELIRINTANDHEALIAQAIADKLAEHHIESQIIEYAPGRSNLIAEIGSQNSQPVIALTGHMDTVLTGDITTWEHNPFGGEIVANKMYGRGTADMKSGLVAMLFAFIKLHENAASLSGRVRLIFTIGEENGAQGSHQLTELGYVDDIDAMIVGEPTDGQIVYAHNGSYNYTIESVGKQVHSSMPELGINALTNVVKYLNIEPQLFTAALPHPDLGPVVHSVTMLHSGEQINNIPAQATLRGNIRPVPTFNNDQVTERITAAIAALNQEPGVHLEFTVDHSFWPVATATDAKLVQVAQQAYGHIFNEPATLSVIHGATDASEFVLSPHKFDVVVMGPGPWSQAHMVDEYVDLEQFEKMIDTYVTIIEFYFSM